MVAHIYNPSVLKAEAGGLLNLRLAWLLCEALS